MPKYGNTFFVVQNKIKEQKQLLVMDSDEFSYFMKICDSIEEFKSYIKSSGKTTKNIKQDIIFLEKLITTIFLKCPFLAKLKITSSLVLDRFYNKDLEEEIKQSKLLSLNLSCRLGLVIH